MVFFYGLLINGVCVCRRETDQKDTTFSIRYQAGFNFFALVPKKKGVTDLYNYIDQCGSPFNLQIEKLSCQ